MSTTTTEDGGRKEKVKLTPARPQRRGPDYAVLVHGQPREPKLVMAFGPKSISAAMTCADVHPNGPIPEGSRLCCTVCGRTGIDDHPRLRRDAMDRNGQREWPRPDPRPDPDARPDGGTGKAPRRPGSTASTRKERRAAKFGDQSAQPDAS